MMYNTLGLMNNPIKVHKDCERVTCKNGKIIVSTYGIDKKYVLKENKEKLKINVITGRKNHRCKFLEDNQTPLLKMKREINLKLHDIFEGKKDDKCPDQFEDFDELSKRKGACY